MADKGTLLCSNCKHDIPEANFILHETHCRRNIILCDVCQESIPRTELLQHKEQEHSLEQCKCGLKIEKRLMETHQIFECRHRLVPCQYCELELVFSQSIEHEEYCGTRTEPCPVCKCNILLREKAIHPALCGNLTPPQERRTTFQPPGAWFETQSIHNLLRGQERSNNNNFNAGLLGRRGQPRPLQSRLHNSTKSAVGSGARRNMAQTNNEFARLLDQDPELENNNSLLWPQSELPNSNSSNLDYLLALSLQNVEGVEEPDVQQGLWTDVWDQRLGRAPASNTLRSQIFSSNNNNTPARTNLPAEIMLPCEFCEELFPEEDLTLHQTGCSPASAIASFSKQPLSLYQEVSFAVDDIISPRTPSPTNFPYSVSLLSCSPPLSPVDGCVLIPCEFCGITLEENFIFHHQEMCDLRPVTACQTAEASASPRKPIQSTNEKCGRISPVRQRRVKPQADPVDEFLMPTPHSWQNSRFPIDSQKPSALRSLSNSGKNTNAELQGKSRTQGNDPETHSSHSDPFNRGFICSIAQTSGAQSRERAEGRPCQRNTAGSKVPKKQNTEKEKEKD